ncbi:MAG: aminoacyl-tRNA hydrolase [Bacteroidota bacterium]|nr:aminoacyl-tRNA hydrolase [Bacteroidota bacterium]
MSAREEAVEKRICVIGLGNPGDRYAQTRHNVGFHVIDRLADALNIRESFFDVNHYRAAGRYKDWTVTLCKPWTWMNNSGEAAAVLVDHLGLNPSEMIVVYDEIQLPLGHLRLRRRGSDGGHNGLASVIYHLGTEDIPRLRCGVDFSPEATDLAAYVLSPFEETEIPLANAMTERAADALRTVMDIGFEKAMNIFNTPPTQLQDSL